MLRPRLAIASIVVLVACTSEATPDAPKTEPEPLARVPTAVDVLTWHYDFARSGVQPNETLLTPDNVSATTFGKRFAFAVDGDVYAQPLYVAKLGIAAVDREVLYVATQHDSVYAFDASGRSRSSAIARRRSSPRTRSRRTSRPRSGSPARR